MLINTNHRATDQRTGDASDTTQHPTPLHRRPYWNQTSAAFSAALWLPAGTTGPRLAHQYSTRLVQQHRGPFLVLYEPHRGTQPRPAQTLFDSRGAGHNQLLKPGRYTPAVAPDSGLSGQRTQKVTIATWLTASRWTYNLTVEILQSGIPAVWKHIASMVMPEVKALHPEWDSVPYQVKRTAVRDACRAMSNVKTFNLELKFQPGTRQQNRRRLRPTRPPQPPEPQAVLLHTRRRRDGARRLSHHSRTAADGRNYPSRATKNADWCRSAVSILAHRSLPGAMRH